MIITIVSQYSGSLLPVEPGAAKSHSGASQNEAGTNGHSIYPPSILMVADVSTHLLGLRQRFENKNCQVHWLDPTLDIFISDSQPHFDLIVLDLTQASDQCLATYQKLKAYPGLVNTPVIILMADREAQAILSGSDENPNYYFFDTPKPIVEDKVEAKIWQLIEQIRYLAARYS